MDSENVTVLVVGMLATAVAIVVPWMAFRFALRQEHVRWLREQRAVLYAEMLVEALAEQEWLRYSMSDAETQALALFEDIRLPRPQRVLLGARGTAMGSPQMNRQFNHLSGIMSRIHLSHSLGQLHTESAQMMLRTEAGQAFDELQEMVRKELHADTSSLGPGRSTFGP